MKLNVWVGVWWVVVVTTKFSVKHQAKDIQVKSRKVSSESPAYKKDKKLSTVSLRVSCAAEELLSSILQRVGHSSDSCSPEELFINNLVDEEHVASGLGNVACDPWFRPAEGFKYY